MRLEQPCEDSLLGGNQLLRWSINLSIMESHNRSIDYEFHRRNNNSFSRNISASPFVGISRKVGAFL